MLSDEKADELIAAIKNVASWIPYLIFAVYIGSCTIATSNYANSVEFSRAALSEDKPTRTPTKDGGEG